MNTNLAIGNYNTILPYLNTNEIKLDRWLKSKAKYAKTLFDTEQSERYKSYFNCNYTPEKGYISPYKDNDIDIKNASSIRYGDECEYSTDMSDFYKDKEITFIPGSNHCNANYLYKRVSEHMAAYNPEIPVITNKNGKIKYKKKNISTRINKNKFYALVMNISA